LARNLNLTRKVSGKSTSGITHLANLWPFGKNCQL